MKLQDDGAGFVEPIGCLTYQSRAASPPSEEELAELVEDARARNKSVNVTGMLLYEDGRFLQTLEGPLEGLEAIWTSIQKDKRHGDIEVLTEHLVHSRLFSDWDLLLYRKGEEAPPRLIDKLLRKNPLAKHVEKCLRLALDADETGLNDLLAGLAEKGATSEEIAARLLEPTARALGDAWLADECSEFDLTLALGLLQMAGHAVRRARDADELRSATYSILLVSAPGEPHTFGPAILADQFEQAGWDVEMAFPRSDEELAERLDEQQPDAVDIALSDALPRHSRISELRETVKQSRFAMPDHPLVVSVGGRLFAEAAATAEHVGADHARVTSAGTQLRITELVAHAKGDSSAG